MSSTDECLGFYLAWKASQGNHDADALRVDGKTRQGYLDRGPNATDQILILRLIPIFLANINHLLTMAPPQWVKDLKPAPPQGVDLIKAERDKSNISVEKLSNFLFTKEVLDRQEKILAILQAEKVFDKSQNYFDGRVDRFKTALARAKRMRQLQVIHNWNRDEYMTANELVSEPGPYGLHASMYLVCYSSATESLQGLG